MSSRPSDGLGASGDAAPPEFVEHRLVPYLRKAQNSDGGWGFAIGSASRIEPTAWALLALSEVQSCTKLDEVLPSGFQYLETWQLSDGSWPSVSGQTQGSWVTSLACWALLLRGEPEGESVYRGVRWLLRNKPGEARLVSRSVRRLTAARQVTAQNPDYFGWSWTLGTASWVEPTAYALLALDRATSGGLFRGRALEPLRGGCLVRTAIAEKMLWDRMCPCGGWNAGNPMVYGVAGQPQVGPTVWALLALRTNEASPAVQKSLDWLFANRCRVRSIESMALTQIVLAAFERSVAESRGALLELWANEETTRTVQGAAWSLLATTGKRGWLTAGSREAVD